MNPKQEILEMLPQGAIRRSRIRAILETHELVPVDTRPFDPTLCGFEHTYHEDGQTPDARQWSNGDYVITRDGDDGHLEEIAGAGQMGFPWPATQSDGKKLLELLGVLEK